MEATTKKYDRADTLPPYGSLRTIARLVGEHQEVLDVGCSSGYLGEILMRRGSTVYGIDGNEAAVGAAKKIYKDVLCLNLNALPEETPFGGKRFDVIVFADVLEHLLDPEGALRYFKRCLKPHGRVIISLPNVALWRVRLNLLFGSFNYADYGVLDRTHLHLYTFKTARELVQHAGYSVRRVAAAANLTLLGKLNKQLPWVRSLFAIQIVIEARNS